MSAEFARGAQLGEGFARWQEGRERILEPSSAKKPSPVVAGRCGNTPEKKWRLLVLLLSAAAVLSNVLASPTPISMTPIQLCHESLYFPSNNSVQQAAVDASETAHKWAGSRNKRPHVFLHVGPHKTGSSSLQGFLERHAHILHRDGIRQPSDFDLPGKFHRQARTANLAYFLQSRTLAGIAGHEWLATVAADDLWDRFTSWALEAKAANSSIVLSSEEFDRPFVDLDLFSSLLPTEQTTIVVGYRPFHDFMLSVYREKEAGGEKGTLVTWLQPEIIRSHAEIFTDAVVERYSAHGYADIALVPMGSSMATAFVCSVLRAKHACVFERSTTTKVLNTRKKAARRCEIAERQHCVDEDVRAMLINETVRSNHAITCLLRTGVMKATSLFQPEVRFDLGPSELCTCVKEGQEEQEGDRKDRKGRKYRKDRKDNIN